FFFGLIMQPSDLGLRVTKLLLQQTQLFAQLHHLPLRSRAPFFPELATGLKITVLDLRRLELAFALGCLGFPTITADEEFGEQNPGWRAERVDRLGGRGTILVHV